MNIRCLVTLMALVAILGCGGFPTSYDRVESDRIRTLDFMYEPAEAAPGDTVTLTAVFAGKTFEVDSIQWSVSYEVVQNYYGPDTSMNLQPLDEVQGESDYSFSSNTQTVVKRFVIPRDVIAKSPAIPNDWLANVPNEQVEKLPETIRSTSKQEALMMLNMLVGKAAEWKSVLGKRTETVYDSLMTSDTLFNHYVENIAPMLPAVLQMFSAPIRIFADLPHAHRVQSDYTVRFNRKLTGLPKTMVYENRNPVIDSIVVYKVNKANIISFDPHRDNYQYETMRLLGPGDQQWDGEIDTLVIDKGYSYFLNCLTQPPESLITLDSAVAGGGGIEERYSSMWYYQLEDAVMEEVSHSDYLAIVNMGNVIAALLPSGVDRIRKATIWLELRDGDGVTNEIYRPMASTLKEVNIAFKYTKAYLDSKE